jgi:hypothetical protein
MKPGLGDGRVNDKSRLVLYLDDSHESQKVRSAFLRHGLTFDVIAASGQRAPGLRLGNQYLWGSSHLISIAGKLAAPSETVAESVI